MNEGTRVRTSERVNEGTYEGTKVRTMLEICWKYVYHNSSMLISS